ncbi:MAG TPA: CocE/NonD family hydrolase [Gammaproteobacteria bacterium]|nr:CocE/NonD family hydrolase [Gammaproteobacteria bacterium]
MLALLLTLGAWPTLVAAQNFGFEPPTEALDPALPAALRDLAERVLPVYEENDPDRYFSTLAALQMAVGDPAAARTSRATLRERLQSEQSSLPPGRAIVYDIYVGARALEGTENVPFASAYNQTFNETMGGLDDLAAYEVEGWFVAPTDPLRERFQHALDRQRGQTSITLEEALELVQAWFAFEAYRSADGLVRPLLAEDNARRYIVEELSIPVAQDATIAAALVRPRGATADTLPTLLEFTLDRSSRDAREAAAHGYASVLALARIAGDAASRPRAPFESDGDDARAAIDWIASQPWSDGRVGMQGVRYGGFVAWSAAKRLPPALKAIATSDPIAPGIDVPQRNGIFLSSAYRWVYEMLAPPDDEGAGDDARWRGIDEDWYRSGRQYRELPALPGRGSAVFRRWLNHPSYDRFWQKWLPFGDEFASVDIPALTVTGYYSAGQTAALYYFTQHVERNPNADHTLLIGPFDEHAIEHGASASVRELGLDLVARVAPGNARYEWFEHVLRGAERPAILGGQVNYQLDGANEWHHAPSLTALESNRLRFYLAASPDGAPHALLGGKPGAPMSLTQTADLRDRADAELPKQELVLQADPHVGMLFVTEPFDAPVDLAGRFRGELDFTINKYDVDLVVMLYELRSHGEYVSLFDPPFAFRASYARDRVNRRLLLAGVRQQLPFQSDRMVGRRLQPGSRLVLALAVNKRPDQQVNYGTAGDVSEASIEDAGAPLRIRWHEGSFIEIPARDDQGPSSGGATDSTRR